MMSDDRYKTQVELLLSDAKKDEVFLVTGFLTTKMTRWTTSAGREHGQVEIEEIFAIAFDVIKHKHSLDKKVKHWMATTKVLGDVKRTKAGHLAFGDEDSDEEIEYHLETEEDDALPFVLEHDVLLDADKGSDKPGYLDFDNR
ncbi:MAG: hypothetical protein Q9161_007941 [Pseudevernia consocians]